MDMEVLTFRQQGVALLVSVQFASGGPSFVSPSRIPWGLEQSWQTAWNLWKGLERAQRLFLHSYPLVGRWAGSSAPHEGLAASTWKGPLGKVCHPGWLGLKLSYRVGWDVWGIGIST